MDASTIHRDVPGVVGMVHLPPLPGAPRFDGDRAAIRDRAVRDAEALAAGGVDAILVENFGDAPFYPDDVPKHVVASMTALVGAVADAVDLPVGVNVLRNDCAAALSVAAATSASFVRVNVHAGARVTDQGVVEGRAHETMRLRERLDADAAVFADVDVKHSSPLGTAGEGAGASDAAGTDDPVPRLRESIAEVVERGLADGVIVSGRATGDAVDLGRLHAAREVVDDLALDRAVPVLAGSGVTPGTIGAVLERADGAIVGTALKDGGVTTNPVDPDRVRALVEAARRGPE
jgi:hypothetical protein